MDRSLIAGANAWFRAAESQRSDKILDDPWAIHLAERDLRVQAIRFGRFAIPPLRRQIAELQVAHCVRHRAIDERILQAVREGYEQIVIVGAGYDMRATRLNLPNVVEIDHPSTQQRKIERLKGLAIKPVKYVALDLTRDDLQGYDPALPTCFVAEGLIHYLSMQRLEALLSAPAVRRRWILSFIRTEMYLRAGSMFLNLVRAVREIPRLHLTTEALARVFESRGFHHFRSWTGEQQVSELVPQARGRAFALSQDVAEAQ
ncbi:MAG: class I SAM-dependent methyltransferase [Polyangiales bacterium]